MLFKSPFPTIKIPEIPLPNLVLRKTEQLGSKPALVDGSSGDAISYAELGIKAKRLASGLPREDSSRVRYSAYSALTVQNMGSFFME